MSNLRPDLEVLENEHEREMKKPLSKRAVTRLERLIMAFDYIQKLPPDNPQSYFWLSSYHGYSNSSVFSKMREIDPKNGIYCVHGNLDFIAWHRPYLSVIEKALQSYDKSVMLPFWNQISATSVNSGIPKIFRDPQFTKTDGSTIPNPLNGYTYQLRVDSPTFARSQGQRTSRTSKNIGQLLYVNVVPMVKRCLNTEDYAKFAATDSGATSVEEPHNYLHGVIGAKGDMSVVQVSSFDPIFYFHHCFYDYIFWSWQVKYKKTTKLLDHDRFLVPWRAANKSTYHNHNSVANIKDFQYDYPPFNYALIENQVKGSKSTNLRGITLPAPKDKSQRIFTIRGINISKLGGSFFLHVYAKSSSDTHYELGKTYIFHTTAGCENCEIIKYASASFPMRQIHIKEENDLEFKIKMKLNNDAVLQFKQKLRIGVPVERQVWGIDLEVSYN